MDWDFDFSIRETRAECLNARLCFFVLLNDGLKPLKVSAIDLVLLGAILEVRERIEDRLPIVGAFIL